MSELKTDVRRELAERLSRLDPSQTAAFLARLEAKGVDVAELPIVAAQRPEELPLSYAQQRLWIIDRIQPGAALYNAPIALRLHGELNQEALQTALDALLARHEVLRTTFDEEGGKPRQVIHVATSIRIARDDLSSLSSSQRPAAAQGLARAEAQTPFDLTRGPLFRVKLLRLSAQEHWLLLTLHHAVSDEWTLGILVREFTEFYNASVEQRRPALAPLALQYADYALWQKLHLSRKVFDQQLAYWTNRLGPEDYVLALPTDFLRSGSSGHDGAEHRFHVAFDAARFAALRKSDGLSPFVVVLAAFEILLSRYSGQADVRVGVPIAGRNRPELEGLVGFFANTQVLRTEVQGRFRVIDYLRRVQAIVADASSNQDLPFDRLVEALQPSRAVNQTPLFDVMLSWHRGLDTAPRISGLDVTWERSPITTAKFDLTLHVTETERGLSGQFVYRTSLFAPPTIERMADHLNSLVRQILENPRARIAQLALTDTRDAVGSVEAVSVSADNSGFRAIHDWISDEARRKRDVIAVRSEDGELSYTELEARATALACQLRRLGVRPGQRVALCLPRSCAFVTALYAVLKSGAAYVPLEPKQPPARLRALLEDSGAGVLVTLDAIARELSELGEIGLTVLTNLAPAAASEVAFEKAVTHPNSVAYVIYTSGSTGRPKGVLVTHQGLSTYVQGVLARLSSDGAVDGMAMVSTVGADLGNTVLFGALCSGTTLHLLSEAEVFDPAKFGDYMSRHAVGALKIVPGHLRALLGSEKPERILPRRALILGGEATPWELVREVRRHSDCRILNHYGPTETTVGVLTYEYPNSECRAASLPLGKPLRHSSTHVLGRDLELVPEGIPGELYVGGAGLAHGYLERPEQTAERFIPDPFGPAGSRLYRTGDRARVLEGNVEFLGRSDDQIKVRGHRVEPREVRSALLALPEIVDAYVCAGVGPSGAVRLEAFLVGAGGFNDTGTVSAKLAEQLPEYMVPAEYVWLERLPLTRNGKLDRSALPKGGTSVIGEHRGATSELERQLLSLWKEVLKLESLGVDDNFFKSGGDSLLAFQLVALAHRRGLRFSIQTLFAQQTVAQLAAELERPLQVGVRAGPTPTSRTGVLPLSYGQQRLWFLWRLDPHSAAYNVPVAVRMKGNLNRVALEAAFLGLMQRHEVLRTQFVDVEGRAGARVLESVALSVPLEDLSDRSPADAEGEAKRVALTEARLPFDLTQGPALRVRLLRLGPNEHVLLMTLHHIVSDGWSAEILFRELCALYSAHVKGESHALPDADLQYADYAAWQRKSVESGELEEQLKYWVERLGSDHSVLDLTLDRARPSAQSFQGAALVFDLDATLSEQLRELAQRHNATLFMLLLAAFQLLLSRYTGQSEIRVGVPNANRSHPSLERMVGFFVNTEVLTTKVDANSTVLEVLEGARQAAVGAQANQDAPFELVVERLNPGRSLSHNPLFQVMFNHQRRVNDVGPLVETGVAIEPFGSRGQATQFDLTLDTFETSEGIHACFTYAVDLFDVRTPRQLARHYVELLKSIVDNPCERVGRLRWFDGEAREALQRFNLTQKAYGNKLVHRAFEDCAARSPNAVAVVFEGRQLTYRELDEQANQLASRLRERGVDRDDLVGICAERSLELVVALLGILKAGAGYLALDPEHPADRLAYLVSEARPRVTLVKAGLERVLDEVRSTHALVTLDEWCRPGPVAGAWSDRTRGENVVHCLYTSGSTGRPKGVLSTHGGLCNRLAWMQERYCLTAADRVLQKTPLSFDVSVWEFFWPLTTGATLVLAPPGAHRDPKQLADVIVREGVTTMHFVPAMLQAMLASGELRRCGSLRQVMCSGEALALDLARRFRAQSSAALHNLYGPTEASIDVTSWEYDANAAEKPGVPIGLPIANTEIHLVDEALQLVPPGAVGELCIGGVGLARGYLEQPALTAERFVPSPFGHGGGERIYRTGDLARRRHDGVIEYCGRNDQQVKIRGFRIELGEIEACLRGQPGVVDCAVLVVQRGEHEGRQLVAYVVPEDQELLAAETVRWQAFKNALVAALGSGLPEYMVPRSYVALPRLPLTVSGKLDRKSLRAPGREREERLRVAPSTELERLLVRVWSECLGVPDVGVTDNFFELGGDSIIVLKVVWTAREAGVELTAKQVFQHQTIAALAGVVGALSVRNEAEEEAAGTVALTPIQHWFFEKQLSEPHHYNQAVLVQIRERVELPLLRRALAVLIQHHDAFSLRFRIENCRWEQWFTEGADEASVWSVDLSSEPDPVAAQVRVAERAQRSLDFERGPVYRVVHFSDGDSGSERLLWVIHHLVVDGVSWRTLLEDLHSVYRQLSLGQAPSLPRKTSSYLRWSRHLQTYSASPAVLAQAPYWLGVLRDVRHLGSAPNHPRNTEAEARKLSVELDRETTRGLLQRAPRLSRVQTGELLLAALALTLAPEHAANTVVVEVEGHGREELFDGIDVSRTVGWFTTMYPVRLTADPASLGATLRQVQHSLREAPDKGVSFGVLRYLSSAKRDFELAPRPDVRFNYLGKLDTGLGTGAFFGSARGSIGTPKSPRASRDVTLEVTAAIASETLSVSWSYCESLLPVREVERLAQRFLSELRRVIAHSVQHEPDGVRAHDLPVTRAEGIEDVFPLSPMQQGMLFHSLLNPRSGVYVNQRCCEVDADLNLAAFGEAWRRMLAAHSALRTCFAWEGLESPVQVVCRPQEPPISVLDWSEKSAAQCTQDIEVYVATDRARGFDLISAPLLRVTLIRRPDARWTLVWTQHHIVMDGWSSARLISELFREYQAATQGAPPAPVSPDHYRGYVEWLERQNVQGARGFWRETLLGFAAPTLLGGRVAAGASRDHAQLHEDLPRALSAEFVQAARGMQVTLNTLFQGALALLIATHTSSADVVFGVTLAGRNAPVPGIETLLGLFINTLPLRVRMDASDSVVVWLQTLQAHNAALREHELAPLMEVQALADLPKGQPLFDTLLVFENYPVARAMESASVALGIGNVRSFENTHYALAIEVVPGEQIRIAFDYDGAAFSQDAARRLLEHFVHLLKTLARTPQAKLFQLANMTSAERAQILSASRGAVLQSAANGSYVERFEAEAARRGNRVAARCLGKSVSYAELNRQSNRVGHALSKLGVLPDDVVAVVAERGLVLLTQTLGVLKAGAGFLALEPRTPEARLSECLEASGARVVLVTEATRPKVARAFEVLSERPRVVSFEELERWGLRDDKLGIVTGLRHLAYVIYTSGSTGKPKGVMVEQAGMLNNQLSKVPYLELGEGDVIAQTAAQSFDIWIWQLLLGPLCGATVDIVGDEIAQDPVALFQYVAERGITVLEMVPSLLEIALSSEELPPEAALKLRWLLATGEGLPARLAERWRRRYPGIGLVNAYGPAECSDDVTLERVGDESLKTRGGQASIGRPVTGTNVYVLDEHLRLAPRGATGQLSVSGIGVGRGYLNDPVRTAESFVPDPLSETGGGRLYRTGDLGRQLDGGALDYVGRSDQQVKIRGQRIELGEIEARLQAQRGVNEAAVLALDHESGDKRLVAYVVLEAELRSQDAETVRRRLTEALTGKLPDYMVPRHYVVLEQLPLNANGKLDRKALPAPDASVSEESYAAPQTELEQGLCEIWQEVLSVSRVGTTDNFFDLGGNSLLAVKVTSRVRAKLGVELELRAIFDVLTVRALAERLESVEGSKTTSDDLAAILDQLEGEEGLMKAGQC